MTSLRIDLDWEPSEHGVAEDRATTALLSVAVGDCVATSIDDRWSQSVRNTIRVAAFPLALWFANSWWRLRWESSPQRGSTRRDWPMSWRMAHEMPAAGYGFLWPPLSFDSDGEFVEIVCTPSGATHERARFLSNCRRSVAGADFEQGVDQFVALVLNRLDQQGLRESDLHRIWPIVLAERADPAIASWRRWEALLGFDPDEAPEEIMDLLTDLVDSAGMAALDEIAAALNTAKVANPTESLGRAIRRKRDAQGRFKRSAFEEWALDGCAPWERGRDLARRARREWGIGGGPVSDDMMEDLVGAPILDRRLSSDAPRPRGRPFELQRDVLFGRAVRAETGDKVDFYFSRHQHESRRFEAARFLGDFLVAPAQDRWLPTTDAKTARQKTQRAFAAEFLIPIDELQASLGGNYEDEEALEEAALHFGVSSLAVRSHLANNDLISRF